MRNYLKLSLSVFCLSSSALFGGFFGSGNEFDSPIQLTYDFSEIPSLEAMVIAQNEGNSSNEIAAAEMPSKPGASTAQ